MTLRVATTPEKLEWLKSLSGTQVIPVYVDTGQVEQSLKRLMNDKPAMKELVELRVVVLRVLKHIPAILVLIHSRGVLIRFLKDEEIFALA